MRVHRQLLRGCWALALLWALWPTLAEAAPRFPPPDFIETKHQVPATTTPAAVAEWREVLDLGLLVLALGTATWLVHYRRSRRGLWWLSLACLAWFGFWREGCVCPIGGIQNLAASAGFSDAWLPLSVLATVLVPLVFALFVGRVFCAGVCPHGALQDLLLWRPVTVPAWLESGLRVIPWVYLAGALAVAAAGGGYLICEYDPFVPLFRLAGGLGIVLFGLVLVVTSLFVGRPYCRFLCPYGALLSLGARLASWRVGVHPGRCLNCRLCEESCPYGALNPPHTAPAPLAPERRRRLGWTLAGAPVILALGIWLGGWITPLLGQSDPPLALAAASITIATQPELADEAIGDRPRAAHEQGLAPLAIGERARQHLDRLRLTGQWAGGLLALVLIGALLGLGQEARHSDYRPDQGRCLGCARCFETCPVEHLRRGRVALLPTQARDNPPPA